MKILIFALVLLVSVPTMAADDLNTIYQGYAADTETALDQPHRGIGELGRWLSDTVATTLQYAPGRASAKLTEIRPLFSEQGYKAYTDFLTKMGYADALQKQTLNLSSVVNSTPLLLGQGASAGRYAWVYEMQVILSATAPGAQDPVSQTINLRVQIGRNAKAPAPQGVLIENWQSFDLPADGSGKPVTTP